MNQSLIVKPSLDMARRDLGDAQQYLTKWWQRGGSLAELDHRDQDVHSATEALMRAISSVSLAVERLAELVVD